MHPLLKSPKNLIIVGIIWGSIILGMITLHNRLANVPLVESAIFIAPLMVIELFFALSTWYLCQNIKLEVKNVFGIIIKHGLSAVVLIIFWLSLGMLYSEFLDQQIGNELWKIRFIQLVPFLGVLGIFVYIFFSAIHYLILSMEKTRLAEHEAVENRLIASQAELKALRSTIHPHFLFNSLNAFGALARTAPEKAQKVSIKLSDFLRYSLKYNNYDMVTVQSEIDHINNYLGVEQIRMEERLQVKYNLDSSVLENSIPPFILLPLVENAVKHGIQNLVDGGEIQISVSRNQKFLFVKVQNPYDPAECSKEGEKHGLQNLRDRLNNKYGDEAVFNINKNNNVFTVKIYLPLEGENL